MSPLDFNYIRGAIHFPKLDLWLDAHHPVTNHERVFVSHAHSDHTARHREVFLTAPTQRLMESRIGVRPDHVVHTLEFERSVPIGPDVQMTLFPAGHVLGSAMCLLETSKESLLYTGDFKLQNGLAAEPCRPKQANVLIMETTFGRSKYRFPKAEDVLKAVIRFCRECIDHDEVPLLLAYSLGKSQELLYGIRNANLPMMVHPAVEKMTHIYEEFGFGFPPYQTWNPKLASGHLVIAPPTADLASLRETPWRYRRAVMTGWALDPGCHFRYGVDAAFPLSDHADFPDLIEFVRRVNPKQVCTLHGSAAEFAATLRQLKFEARALSEPDQLQLDLVAGANPIVIDRTAEPAQSIFTEPNARTDSPTSIRVSPHDPSRHAPGRFHQFAELCRDSNFEKTKTERLRLWTTFLQSLNDGELRIVVRWITQTQPMNRAKRLTGIGFGAIQKSLQTVYGVSEKDFVETYRRQCDLGETLKEVLASHGRTGETSLGFEEVRDMLWQFSKAQTTRDKALVQESVWRRMCAIEAWCFTRLTGGELRLGIGNGEIETLLADAFEADRAEMRRALVRTGHWDEVAVLAKSKNLNLADFVRFRPYRQPWETLGSWGSGIRCQVHHEGLRTVLFGETGDELGPCFVEFIESMRQWRMDIVFEAEIQMSLNGNSVTLSEWMKRQKIHGFELFDSIRPLVIFEVRDLLWHEGKTWVREPIVGRTEQIQKIDWPSGMLVRP